MNACDAFDVERADGTAPWPRIGESGAALNIIGGKALIPDYGTERAPWSFVRLRLLKREDASPVPGYEI